MKEIRIYCLVCYLLYFKILYGFLRCFFCNFNFYLFYVEMLNLMFNYRGRG